MTRIALATARVNESGEIATSAEYENLAAHVSLLYRMHTHTHKPVLFERSTLLVARARRHPPHPMSNSACTWAFVSAFAGSGVSRSRMGPSRTCGRGVLMHANEEVSQGRMSDARSDADGVDANWTPGRVHAPRPMRAHGGSGRRKQLVQGKFYRVKTSRTTPGLRIAAGSVRGRRIQSPNVYLRPMMGKVREALFSMLDMFETLRSDGVVLDLFAGSGSIGIEALSRGMGRAVFVDCARECVDTINRNLAHCELGNRGKSVCERVEEFVKKGDLYNEGKCYELITVTPPYEEVDYARLMKVIARSPCVGEGTVVVVEYPVELKSMPPALENRLVGIRNRRYGRTVLAVYACEPGIHMDRRSEEFVNVKRRGR